MLPRHAETWLPGMIQHQWSRKVQSSGAVNVYFCLADHYEPGWRGADMDLQRERVQAWLEQYPACASRHRDSGGRHPQHTFFFPEEEYQPEHLDKLASLCQRGWGDVEVHLHHDGDTPAGLTEKLLRFTGILHQRHGLLRKDSRGKIRYGFIHGDWALNNSRPDRRSCGVDDETSVLLETGCYADFTMPCGAHPSQSRKVNAIYYALPQRLPRAHDHGPDARAGTEPPPGLLMVQGPLSLNWASRKWHILPRLEAGDIAWHTPPAPNRARLWVEQHVHVQGAPEHIFVKLSTHGAQDQNIRFLLSKGLDRLWSAVEEFCGQRGHRLHYVTAGELFLKIRGLELGPAATPWPAARLTAEQSSIPDSGPQGAETMPTAPLFSARENA